MPRPALLAGASGYSFKEWKGSFYPDTRWQAVHAHFMHEPTAPVYAGAMLRLAASAPAS